LPFDYNFAGQNSAQKKNEQEKKVDRAMQCSNLCNGNERVRGGAADTDGFVENSSSPEGGEQPGVL
jgi:hypothetical protein